MTAQPNCFFLDELIDIQTAEGRGKHAPAFFYAKFQIATLDTARIHLFSFSPISHVLKALTSPDIVLRMNFGNKTNPSIGKVCGMLEGYQRKFLRGRAHRLKPIVLIGQNGLTGAIVKTTDEALNKHELIKVKFNAYKEKDEKTAIIAEIENRTSAQLVGLIGHTAIFYRENSDPEKQKITLPVRSF
jgi:RNA-binding protein